MTFRILAIVLLAMISTAPAWGRGAPTRREQQETACYSDAVTLCGEFVPDEAKITACMEKKKAQLSPPCAALFNDKN